ncbi:MAG: four helix bundle protein [Prolixibacteraceae bacterium]|jgi:four helix bundle protein|nr:four helix bundle protein [Prolixibacteraceae bacterium]
MKENVVMDKSFKFALNVIKVGSFLIHEKHEFILSKQLVRSGTSIGALIKEAEHAQSKADFINKMNIALKEANEIDMREFSQQPEMKIWLFHATFKNQILYA